MFVLWPPRCSSSVKTIAVSELTSTDVKKQFYNGVNWAYCWHYKLLVLFVLPARRILWFLRAASQTLYIADYHCNRLYMHRKCLSSRQVSNRWSFHQYIVRNVTMKMKGYDDNYNCTQRKSVVVHVYVNYETAHLSKLTHCHLSQWN